MTKSELIKALEQYPDSLRVIVAGYESGYDDIAKIGIRIITPDSPSEVCGKYKASCHRDCGEQAIFLRTLREYGDR